MSANDSIRRQLGSGMVGDHYDMSQQACAVRTIDGTVICQPGETKNDWKNEFVVPVKLFVRGGKVQKYEFLFEE